MTREERKTEVRIIKNHLITVMEDTAAYRNRLGCIGCPMGTTASRERDFYRWPKYKDAYMRAFAKMIERRKEHHAKNPNKPIWRARAQDVMNPTPQDVFNWWMEYDVLIGQQSLFDEPESDDDE